MSLDANALVDRQAAKDFLRVTGSTDDLLLDTLINRASDICETWCNRPLKERVLTNVRMVGPCTPRLFLLAVPIKVTAPLTVALDGVAQTVWKDESDGDPAGFNVLVQSMHPEGSRGPDHLYRAAGWLGTRAQPYNVLLSYTGGFVTVPEDLQQACLYIVQKLYRDVQKQLVDVVMVQTAGGGLTLLDTPLPRVIEILLTPYRLAAVAG